MCLVIIYQVAVAVLYHCFAISCKHHPTRWCLCFFLRLYRAPFPAQQHLLSLCSNSQHLCQDGACCLLPLSLCLYCNIVVLWVSCCCFSEWESKSRVVVISEYEMIDLSYSHSLRHFFPFICFNIFLYLSISLLTHSRSEYQFLAWACPGISDQLAFRFSELVYLGFAW